MSLIIYLKFALMKRHYTAHGFQRLMILSPFLLFFTVASLLTVYGLIAHADEIDNMTQRQGIGTLIMLTVFLYIGYRLFKKAK